MSSFSTVVLLGSALLALALADTSTESTAGQYISRFENVDIEKILGNKRLLAGYINCFTDRGQCTPEAKDIKEYMPDVIATSCAKCTPKLRKNIIRIVKEMRQKYPEEWNKVNSKFDPNNEHAKELEEFLDS